MAGEQTVEVGDDWQQLFTRILRTEQVDIDVSRGADIDIEFLEVHGVEAGGARGLHVLEERPGRGNGQLVDGCRVGSRVNERLRCGLERRDRLRGTLAAGCDAGGGGGGKQQERGEKEGDACHCCGMGGWVVGGTKVVGGGWWG